MQLLACIGSKAAMRAAPNFVWMRFSLDRTAGGRLRNR
jgi:hypothetical protein